MTQGRGGSGDCPIIMVADYDVLGMVSENGPVRLRQGFSPIPSLRTCWGCCMSPQTFTWLF